MKNLTRIRFALFGALIVGIMLFSIVSPRQTDVVAADPPATTPVAVNEAQILLRAKIVDIDRAKMTALGIDFKTAEATPPEAGQNKSVDQSSIVALGDAKQLVESLVANGVAKILAEPMLVTTEGRTARFRSGGEFPQRVPRSPDKTPVAYREFGTSIDVTPRRLADGKFRLEMRLDQSDFYQWNTVDENRSKTPVLNSRQLKTAVELEPGQTVMFFSPHLLVVVTPELVAPLAKANLAKTLPAPLPRFAPWAEPPAAPAVITITALVYIFDAKKLQEAGVDVRKTLTDAELDAETTFNGTLRDDDGIISVIGPRTVARLRLQLSKAKEARVVSRPQIRSLDGIAAEVRIGCHVPTIRSGGVLHAAADYQEVGTSIKVVPVVKGDRIEISVGAEHLQLKDARVESFNLGGVVEVYPGETLALCQNDGDSEQLLVFLTPVTAPAATSVVSTEKTLPQAPSSVRERREAAEAKQSEMKKYLGQTLSRLLQQQAELESLNEQIAPGEPKATQTAPRQATSSPARNRKANGSLRSELRTLRQDVRELRSEVGRLIEILQERDDKTAPAEPTSADARSTPVPAETDDALWASIGLRAEPTKVKVSGYRGGLKISEVRPDSPAANACIRPGDVLVGLDKWETINRSNLGFVLARVDLNQVDRLKFYVLRGEETRFGYMKLAKQLNGTNDAAEENTAPAADSTRMSSWKMSLDEAIRVALGNAKVMRILGLVRAETGSDLVFLSKTNADVDVDQFEAAVRNLLGDVEEAYWNVWVADREVEMFKAARDTAQKIWNETSEDIPAGNGGSHAEAQARARYFAVRSKLEASRAKLYSVEQALRQAMGLAGGDGRLIRPTDEPALSRLEFDWNETLADALANDPDLRRHRLAIKSLELQRAAAKHALTPASTSAVASVTGQLLHNPLLPGEHRRELAQVRNLELRLARERAIVKELESNISHTLSDAIQRLESSFELQKSHFNRQQAARQEAESQAAAFRSRRANLDKLFGAYDHVIQSTLETNEAAKQFAIAAKDVRFCQGSSLNDRGVKFIEVASAADKKSSDQSFDEAKSQHIPDPTVNLKPGDRLMLEFDAHIQPNRHITVLADGTITLPLIGQVPASGHTLTTLGEQLRERYRKYFRDPQCTLSFLGTSAPAR